MRKLFSLIVVVAVALLLRSHFQQDRAHEVAAQIESERREFTSRAEDLQPERDFESQEAGGAQQASYSCDGRRRCTEMHSCEEASWFLANCPGMEMDGDRDGVPCEDQHCGHQR